MSLDELMKQLREPPPETKRWSSLPDSAKPHRSNPQVWEVERHRKLAERLERILS